jgi:hypothetical protein
VYYYGTESARSNASFGGETTAQFIIISGLTPGTLYDVTVRAGNSNGWSEMSAPVRGSTLGGQTAPPAAPPAPAVTTGNGRLAVSWQAVAGASRYEVWFGTTDNEGEATQYGADVWSTSTTITELSNGTTYYVWVKAKNDAGTSGSSPQASGTPLAPPENVQAVPQAAGSILISWNEVAAGVSYRVYRSDDYEGDYTPIGTSPTTSYTDTGLSGGTTYYYTVSTVKGADESEQSYTVSAEAQVEASFGITLVSQNDVGISEQSVVIQRGESRTFRVTGDDTGGISGIWTRILYGRRVPTVMRWIPLR